MGRKRRMKPERLAEKLSQIRNAFDVSQTELLRRLGFEGAIDYRRISEFESGDAEPPLPVLLQYARVAGVQMEDLVDDELDLPAKLPSNVIYARPKRKSSAQKKRQ